MIPGIFREYDIRGIADKDLTEEDVVLIGKGIGTFLRREGNTKLSVGRDCRLTSDRFSEKLIAGLLSTGCDVTDIGVCPTPVLYFSIHHLKLEGGVMLTASHNPPEYNGFKVCSGLASVHGKDLQAVYELIRNNDFEEGQGERTTFQIIPPYLEFLQTNITIDRPLNIGIDAGNGTAGVVAVPIFTKLGCNVHDIYCDMDGRFPNHEADPTVASNMTDLIALVKEKHLDFGIGFDGDGDRIGVVDETGKIIYGDQLIIIFAREILSRKPGATFISEVKCSQTMYDDIRNHGGNPIMWKTGHSIIKKKMKETAAELAGEMSGHIFFSDRYLGYDDATYAALRLAEIVAKSKAPISTLLSDIPKTYSTPEIRVESPDDIKFEIVKRATEIFREKYNVIDIDGARVVFEDGWGLIRASNTQPALVLRFEALTVERLEEIRQLIESTLTNIKKNMQKD